MFQVGDKVKTNNFHEQQHMWAFGKHKPVKLGIVQKVYDSGVLELKLRNGRIKNIHECFIEKIS